MRQATIFFASGTKGLNVRADGSGGVLPRGWYVDGISVGAGRFGPFKTKTEAKAQPMAGPNVWEKPVNRRSAA